MTNRFTSAVLCLLFAACGNVTEPYPSCASLGCPDLNLSDKTCAIYGECYCALDRISAPQRCTLPEVTTDERALQCDPCEPNFAAYACQEPETCVDYVCPQGEVGYCSFAEDMKVDLRFSNAKDVSRE